MNRAADLKLTAGTALTRPDGTVTLDGGDFAVPPGPVTLTSLAAQLLCPFEQLSREALLWAVESAQFSVQQAQAALGASPADPAPPGPDTPVSASHLHALYADLTDPGTPFPLSQVTDFLTSRGITFDLRPMPATAQNPSYTVFPMPPFVRLTAGGVTVDFATGPFLATPDYQEFLTRYFQELAAPAPRPARPRPPGGPSTAARDAGAGGRGAVHRLLRLHPAPAGPGRARPVPRVLLPGAARQHGHPGRHRRPVRPGRRGPRRRRRERDRRGEQELDDFFVPGTTLAVNRRSAQVAPAGETLRALATRLQLTPLLVALAIRRDTGVLAVGSTIQVAGGSYVTGEGDTLASIAARLGAPLDAVTDAAAAVPGLLVPLTPLTLPSGSYVVRPPDTLASIAAATGATLSQVGAAAANVTGLLFAGVGFPLRTLPWTVAASGADPAVAESLDAISARFGTTLAALVAAPTPTPCGCVPARRWPSG